MEQLKRILGPTWEMFSYEFECDVLNLLYVKKIVKHTKEEDVIIFLWHLPYTINKKLIKQWFYSVEC